MAEERAEAFFDKVKTKGRPKLVLNAKGIDAIVKMAEIMCTDEEIAGLLSVSVDTLTREENAIYFEWAKRLHKNKIKVIMILNLTRLCRQSFITKLRKFSMAAIMKKRFGNIKITIDHEGIFYTILYNGDFENPRILRVTKH